MPFWQFYQKNRPIGWIGHALWVQPSISAHRKWPEMVVSASTNQVWTKITIKSYAWSFAIQIQIPAVWFGCATNLHSHELLRFLGSLIKDLCDCWNILHKVLFFLFLVTFCDLYQKLSWLVMVQKCKFLIKFRDRAK